nr:hypothetical protein [Tanacetum cinerariifolium]GEW21947.1 hypothetical protein [Tanacetum cinerariifolium]
MLFIMPSWKQVNPTYKFKWTEKTVLVAEGSLETTTEGYMKNYKNASQDIKNQLDAEAEAVKIILTWIDNDIYSTVDAYPNACEMWKAIERLKQVNKIRAERLERTTNPLALVAQQQPVYYPQNHPTHYTHDSLTKSQQAATREKAIINSPPPTYDQEPEMVAEDDALLKENEIDKLMDLISLSFNKIYKPTNNNLRTSSNTSRANQDNTPRINRGTGYDNQMVVNIVGAKENVARKCHNPQRAKDATYHMEKMILYKHEEAGFQFNAEQVDLRDDTNDKHDDQELEVHYMYMAHIQKVTPDAADNSRPIFDIEPLQKVQNDDDNYNVFANDREHLEQPEYSNDTYLEEQGDTNITIDFHWI